MSPHHGPGWHAFRWLSGVLIVLARSKEAST